VITLRRVVLTLLLLVGVGAIILAFSRTETSGGADDIAISGGDNAVEALIPGRNAETLSQTEVGIDLSDGWTGALVLNGEELPEDQVNHIDALNQLLHRPPDGLDSGQNCITAVIWRVDESREQGREVSWCFEVT
jgi:hypothetical protein